MGCTPVNVFLPQVTRIPPPIFYASTPTDCNARAAASRTSIEALTELYTRHPTRRAPEQMCLTPSTKSGRGCMTFT
jgi:hypothetical protein